MTAVDPLSFSNTGATSLQYRSIAKAPAATLQAKWAGPSSGQPANSKQMTLVSRQGWIIEKNSNLVLIKHNRKANESN